MAVGEDDRGRKQYIYHERWRELRDLLNFYRLITFAEQLPPIRATSKPNCGAARSIATRCWRR